MLASCLAGSAEGLIPASDSFECLAATSPRIFVLLRLDPPVGYVDGGSYYSLTIRVSSLAPALHSSLSVVYEVRMMMKYSRFCANMVYAPTMHFLTHDDMAYLLSRVRRNQVTSFLYSIPAKK